MVTGEIDQLTALSGNLPIVFQEFGCPAGGASTLRNSGSEQAQVEFITAVGHEFATMFGEAHVAEGLSELGARFEETLATIGLLHYSDGTAPPA